MLTGLLVLEAFGDPLKNAKAGWRAARPALTTWPLAVHDSRNRRTRGLLSPPRDFWGVERRRAQGAV